MPAFSSTSLSRLETCHPTLQILFKRVVRDFDCTVLEGYRSKERQDAFFRDEKSKVMWPHSKHNAEPSSMAVDVIPCPLDWNETRRHYYFGGYVLGVARALDIRVRWGGDWNSNGVITDQTFNDLVHFELL